MNDCRLTTPSLKIIFRELKRYNCVLTNVTQSTGTVEYTNSKYPEYDTKQSDGEATVMLEL